MVETSHGLLTRQRVLKGGSGGQDGEVRLKEGGRVTGIAQSGADAARLLQGQVDCSTSSQDMP